MEPVEEVSRRGVRNPYFCQSEVVVPNSLSKNTRPSWVNIIKCVLHDEICSVDWQKITYARKRV